VRKAALLLVDDRERLVCVQKRRVAAVNPLLLAEASLPLTGPLLRSSPQAAAGVPLFTAHPWAELVFYIHLGGRPVALLLLGPPIPAGHYNFQQVEFVRQAGQIVAVAAETIRLFEAACAMSGQLMQVCDRERTRLARDLHDDPIQQMSLVINGLTCLEKRLQPIDAEASEELLRRKESLQQICGQLRDICAGLRSPMLDQGIRWAVAELLQQFEDESEVNVLSTIQVEDDVSISDAIVMAMQQILEEALHNVRRHAQATAVHVTLNQEDGCLVLAVADDGKGMPCHLAAIPSLVRARHFGIAGMHERAELVGGELVIGRSPLGGALVSVSVPLAANGRPRSVPLDAQKSHPLPTI
jgi:signal transduction histidine kinase